MSQQEKRDDGLGSGLIDDFDGTIMFPRFGYSSKIGGGETLLLQLDMETDDPDEPRIEGDDDCVKIIIGKKWQAEGDDGEVCIHESGSETRKIGKLSPYGRWIRRCIDDPEDGGLAMYDFFVAKMEENGVDSLAQLWRHAKIWDGLRFHFKREPYSYQAKDDQGNLVTKEGEELMPVEWLQDEEPAPAKGKGKSKSTPKPVPKGKATAKPAPKQAEASPNGLSPVETIKLRKLANDFETELDVMVELYGVYAQSEDHSAFLGAAVNIGAVASSEALQLALVDEEGGLYAEFAGVAG